MTALVDTGPLVASVDRRDPEHQRVRAFFDPVREPLLVPITVLPEVTYLLAQRIGSHAEASFISALARGELIVEAVSVADLERVSELLGAYADMPLGFVDASIVAVAERLNITRILTLDRRHFAVVRPKHTPAFELLP